MKDNKTKSFGRGELALRYNPHLTPSAARKKLNQWIAHHPTLAADLAQTGFTEKMRSYTPKQVSLIFEALGEP